MFVTLNTQTLFRMQRTRGEVDDRQIGDEDTFGRIMVLGQQLMVHLSGTRTRLIDSTYLSSISILSKDASS